MMFEGITSRNRFPKGFAAKRGPRAIDLKNAKRRKPDNTPNGTSADLLPSVSLCRIEIPPADRFVVYSEGVLCDDSVVSLDCVYKYNTTRPPPVPKPLARASSSNVKYVKPSPKSKKVIKPPPSPSSSDSFCEEELVKEVDDALNQLIEDICEGKSPEDPPRDDKKTIKTSPKKKAIIATPASTPRLSTRIMLKKDKFDARTLLKGGGRRSPKPMSQKLIAKKPRSPPSTTDIIVKLNEGSDVTVQKVPKKVTEEDKKRLLSALNDTSDDEPESNLGDEIQQSRTAEEVENDKVDDSDIYKELQQVVDGVNDDEKKEDEVSSGVVKVRKKRKRGTLKVRFTSINTKRGRPKKIKPPEDTDTETPDLTEDQINQLIIKRKSLSDTSFNADTPPVKPPPKKRGRKSKSELLRIMMEKEQREMNDNATPSNDYSLDSNINLGKVNFSDNSPRERKMAMVTPMRPVREFAVKRTGKRPDERLDDYFSKDVLRLETPDDYFERFFTVEERMIEHNDSFDSDVSDDKEFLSHFILPNREESEKGQEARKETEGISSKTIYDLMTEITGEMPSWNLHILPDSNSFCIAKVTRGPLGIPSMKKTIELDADYNAKVYVNQTFQSELGGVYDSYENIKELIYIVDTL